MSRTWFRFYAELNDHLAPADRYQTLEKTFYAPSTTKDMIEGFGVPHAEIDLIIANGDSVDFSHAVRDGDHISVYPMFESLDITPELRVRPRPLRDPRFVLDVHFGKLAAYLRMLGFDTLYRSDFTGPELVQISAGQHRILLTCDRGLLKRGDVTHGYWLRETDSRRQLAEIVSRFDLARSTQPFTRCMACNGLLEQVSKDHDFQRCRQCSRIYWKGSHYARMNRWISEM
jgi:uncharacterized protein with PIN domain